MYLKKIFLILMFSLAARAADPAVADNTYNHHQKYLILGIEKYLKSELKRAPELYAQKDIDYIIAKITPGVCMGLSMLWLYANRVSEKDNLSNEERDDLDHFNNVYKNLVLFDDSTALTAQERSDVDRFLSHIVPFNLFTKNNNPLMTLPGHVPIQDPTTFLELVSGERPQMNYSIKLVASKALFLNWLKLLVQKSHMIILGYRFKYKGQLHNHAIALYCSRDGSFYYYNSHNEKGPQHYTSLQKVVDAFWKDAPGYLETTKTPNATTLLKHVVIKSFRFSSDLPYTGPTETDLEITMPDLIDVLKHVDLQNIDPEIVLFLEDIDPLSLEECEELLTSEELSEEIKLYCFKSPLLPLELFTEALKTGNQKIIDLFTRYIAKGARLAPQKRT